MSVSSGFGIDPGGSGDQLPTDLVMLEQAIRSTVILAVLISLLGTSLAIILVLWCRLNDVISYYFISLSYADFLCALLIVPFSLYSSLRPDWNFGGDNSVLCKCTAYAHVVLIASSVFTFAWISVDRYAAFMKPSRFSWITSLLLACPVLITKMESNLLFWAHYSSELELCLLNWSSTLAYSTTLGVLVLVPSLCTVLFTSTAIIVAINKPDELEDLQRSILSTDQNFIISLFILISFVLSWLPIIVLQLLPDSLLSLEDLGVLRFAFSWLAIGGGSSKLLVYSFTSNEFRQSICCCFKLTSPRGQVNARAVGYNSPDILDEIKIIEGTTSVSNSVDVLSKFKQRPAGRQHRRRSSPTNVGGHVSASATGTGTDYGSFGLSPSLGISAIVGRQTTVHNHVTLLRG